jgi:hypothetical protein
LAYVFIGFDLFRCFGAPTIWLLGLIGDRSHGTSDDRKGLLRSWSLLS